MAVMKTVKKRKKKNVAVNRKRRTARAARGKNLRTAIALPHIGLTEPLVRFATTTAAVLLVGLVIFGGVELRRFYNDQTYWNLATVSYSGYHQVGEDLLRDVFQQYCSEAGLGAEPNVLAIDIRQVREFYLNQISSLREVTVTRELPRGLRIAVVERQPVALVRVGENVLYQVDAGGVLFRIDDPAVEQYPVIKGLDPANLVVGRASEQPQLTAALNLLETVEEKWRSRIAEIDGSNPKDIIIWVDGYKILLGEGGYLKKFVVLEQLLQQLGGRTVAYINLHSALRPALMPVTAEERG